jgi:dCMP deaminase
MANHVAQWSKDPSTKVGSVIVDKQYHIVSMGFNGFPRGVLDLPERLDNRATKYKMVVHAEANAIVNATQPLPGCTIYATPFFFCEDCTKLIIQSGIKRAVSLHSENERWAESWNTAKLMMDEAGVEWVEYDRGVILEED